MSDWKEVLQTVYKEGLTANDFPARHGCKCSSCQANIQAAVTELASRYGHFLSPREVRGMLKVAISRGRTTNIDERTGDLANQILSRHLGETQCHQDKEPAGIYPRAEDVGLVDDTPAIKASEIERVTGEKVPEEFKWAIKDMKSDHFICQAKPYIVPDGWEVPKAAWEPAPVGFTIPGPWKDSLRRIIHDGKEHTLDREVGELTKLAAGIEQRMSEEIIAITNRLEAIEQRVLADGHSPYCDIVTSRLKGSRCEGCTCGHDKLLRMKDA